MVLKGSSAGPIIRLNARVTPIAAANSANDEIGGLIVGTSVHQGTAANSLVLSNIDDAGDIQMLVNDGGHSKEFLLQMGTRRFCTSVRRWPLSCSVKLSALPPVW